MEKFITDNRTGLKYELVGDTILLPVMTNRRNAPSGYGDNGICVS